MRNLFLLTVAVLFIQACSSESNEFTVEGNYENASGEKVSLIELKTEGMNKVDSTVLDDEGTFNFTGYTNIPKFFVVRAGERKSVTLIVKPEDNIRLTADLDNFNSTYQIEGSEDSREIMNLRRRLEASITRLDSLGRIFRENPDKESMQDLRGRLNKESRKIVDKHKEYTQDFIDRNLNSLASLMALYQQVGPRSYVLSPKEDFEYYKKVDSSLMAKYPNSDPVQSLHSQVEDMKSRLKEEQASNERLGIGKEAPNIALPNPEGDTVTLHSLRGEYVLLDFWASWCKPCRVENPTLVDAYKKYNDQGFEIYQVSLDRKRDAWEKAIKNDNLDWVHVSDLKFWNSSAAQTYNVRSIPANYLLNKKGEIIAKDLRGEALDKKLHEIFKP